MATFAQVVSSSAFNITAIAKVMGVSKPTVTRWAKGDRSPTLINANRLAKALGMKITVGAHDQLVFEYRDNGQRTDKRRIKTKLRGRG